MNSKAEFIASIPVASDEERIAKETKKEIFDTMTPKGANKLDKKLL